MSIAGDRIIVQGPAHARSETPVGYLFADHEIECRGDLCAGGFGTALLPFGFRPAGSGFRAVNPFSLEPHTAGAGGECDAPAVADAGLVRDFDGTSFSFLSGFSSYGRSNCYQVLFTVKASKVSS